MKRKTVQIVVIVALLAMFGQMALGSRRLSLTYDEVLYAAIGYGDLSTGDVAWHGVIGHPPLLNLLTAWPLLLESQRPDARTMPGWGTESSLGYSREVLAEFESLERVALVTRLPVMWMTLILAALVFRWARQVWGSTGALLSLVLFVFDPNVLAHGQLNTTDMGVVLFAFMACYLTARYLRKPTRWHYIGVGLALGAALSSKASGLFWIGGVGLAVFAFWATSPDRTFASLISWLLRGLGWVGIAFLVLWASHLFELRPLVEGGLPVPAASHFAGLPYIGDYMQTGQRVFLNGRWYDNGHWAYFPVAFAVKTPLLTMGLLVATVVVAGIHFVRKLRGRNVPPHPAVDSHPLPHACEDASTGERGEEVQNDGRDAHPPIGREDWILLIAPGAYLVVAMLSALNIGHRHLLPAMPFLYVWLGQVGIWAWTLKAVRNVLGALVGLYAAVALVVFPHYIAYFNVFAGGRGYDYLADSSVDWGQALKELKLWMDDNDVPQVKLAAFTSLDPAWYGIDYEAIPPTVGAPDWLPQRFNPEPGVYAISAVPYQGIWVQDPANYDWFRHREPDEIIGGAILVYDLREQSQAPGMIAMCSNPVPVLNEAQLDFGFGDLDAEIVPFDCDSAWLYRSGDGASGLYVIPPSISESHWGIQHTSVFCGTTYEQMVFWDHPAVTIVECDSPWPELLPNGSSDSSAVSPQFASPSDIVLRANHHNGEAVAEFDGPLDFAGYQLSTEDGLELWTYWLVKAVPEQQLSLMAHLLGPDGAALAVADGLGVPLSSWRVGDVIVQRHRFDDVDVPEGAWFEVGAYWLDTVERWPVLVDGQPVADRVLVPVEQFGTEE